MILTSREKGTSEEQLTNAAEGAGIKVYGMSNYFVEEKDAKDEYAKILLGYASLSEEEIRNALLILQKVWL